MAEGEILQMKKSRKLDIDDETYFEIIRKKTASLIATSMAIGAASATDDEEIVEKMYRIGQDAGIAFQIKDDIFDYQAKGILGKPTGNDIKEKKITLPLLYVLNNAQKSERKRILRLIFVPFFWWLILIIGNLAQYLDQHWQNWHPSAVVSYEYSDSSRVHNSHSGWLFNWVRFFGSVS